MCIVCNLLCKGRKDKCVFIYVYIKEPWKDVQVTWLCGQLGRGEVTGGGRDRVDEAQVGGKIICAF